MTQTPGREAGQENVKQMASEQVLIQLAAHSFSGILLGKVRLATEPGVADNRCILCVPFSQAI